LIIFTVRNRNGTDIGIIGLGMMLQGITVAIVVVVVVLAAAVRMLLLNALAK